MKQLSTQEMEEICGERDVALAFLYGCGAICCGILGGPAGIALGYVLVGAGAGELL